MTKCVILLIAGGLLAGIGCAKQEDPRDRPGFIDTSDPSKVRDTMKAPPKGKRDPTSLTGRPPGGK